VTGLALVAIGAIVAIGAANRGWRRYAPYRLLYEIGPPFSVLRGTARGWMIGLCGLGLLGGMGALVGIACIERRIHRATKAAPVMVATVLVLLILLEGYNPEWFNRPNVRVAPVDIELARHPDRGGVVYLPMNTSDGFNLTLFTQPGNLLGTTLRHRPTPNGFSGYFPPSYYRNARALLSLPSLPAIALLRRLGMRYVVVHPSVAGSGWAGLRVPSAAVPLHYLGTFGGDELYQVPAH
jgi:hypothetical protein